MGQFRYFVRMFDRIADVPGDVVECGLGQGLTFAMLAYLAGSEGRVPLRTLRGFDSFQGFPEPTEQDQSSRNPKRGEWSIDGSVVRMRLQESGIFKAFPELPIRITPGFFEDTLPKEGGYGIAFLHLDVDIYPSYRDCLRYLFPMVAPGGVVLFDEYKWYSVKKSEEEIWPGATKAIDEYLDPRGYKPEYYPEMKKYFVIKR